MRVFYPVGSSSGLTIGHSRRVPEGQKKVRATFTRIEADDLVYSTPV